MISAAKGARFRMDKKIVILDGDKRQCLELCAMLEEQNYRAVPSHSLPILEEYLQRYACLAVILDIDTVSVDNRIIRKLTMGHPGVYFLCLSEQPFHPELKDAICYHLYACLNKPVDPDELFYWLRSIYENDANPKNQPEV